MYGPTDLKKGTVIQLDGKPFRVTDYSQKVMGRGGSIVNVKLKNLIDSTTLSKTFKGADKIEPASVSTRSAQYHYTDTQMHFMGPTTFDQFTVNNEVGVDVQNYIKEGDIVGLQFFDSTIINIELPKNVYLKVTYTEDVVKGDTANSITKNATTETGLVVKVPAFIKVRDINSVDTETGAYRERQKNQ
ncbi:MAG TPA: elongation factor P [Candidatus Saccharibacteria bacterium]|jgi:elongation factor P|nr:elongation factor P [Candidatus Saccharibacteria bacterium]HMT39962.1 elongation factor P [Candidatus Saccharibacteria bacterium]